jgi:hypothetical protein
VQRTAADRRLAGVEPGRLDRDEDVPRAWDRPLDLDDLYASEFSFAAAFKRREGMAPGRWRARARAAA